MKTRVISGILFALIMFSLLYIGGNLLISGLLLFALIGEKEFFSATGVEGRLYPAISYIATAAVFYFIYLESRIIPEIILLTLMVYLTVHVLYFPRIKSEMTIKSFFGFCYVGLLMPYIFILRNHEQGFFMVLLALSSWLCDCMSYFSGCAFGKHKMAKILSPKKTWEGAIGGVISTVVIAYVYGMILRHFNIADNTFPLRSAIACLLGAVGSIFGDLAASSFKREYGIKDYGNLIPGHGGILDRFDSILFSAPIIYFVLKIMNIY